MFALKQQSNNIFVGKYKVFLCFRLRLLFSFVFYIRIKRFLWVFRVSHSEVPCEAFPNAVVASLCSVRTSCSRLPPSLSISFSPSSQWPQTYLRSSLSLSLSPTRALQHCMRSFGCESLFARPIAAIWIVVRDIVLSITI